MWANAQDDDRPAEYRWRPLFNAAKFGRRPLLECRAIMLLRCETRWNLLGCPKLANRSKALVGRSSPHCEDMWRTHCCSTSFFPIVDTCLCCEDIAQKSCGMVRKRRIFGDFFCVLHFQRARFRPASWIRTKAHTMCGSMVESNLRRLRSGEEKKKKLEIWANDQRDDHPAEYRWRPVFNAAKFGWCPLLECRAIMLPRRETRWNLLGCPKLANRSKALLGRSSPYYQDTWRKYRCLTSFFLIVDTCLNCEDTARQTSAMVPRWRFFCIIFASCTFSKPCAAHFRHTF